MEKHKELFEAFTGSWRGTSRTWFEPGKLADLVVVQGNPLEDLRLSQKVQLTMIHGRLFDADSMNEIGHQPRKRQPFYFESGDISGMHPATGREIHEKKLRHHWIH